MRIESQLQIVYWPVSKLTRYIRNPRKNDAVVDRICGSIREYGFVVPILAKADGTVIDGDLRLTSGITSKPAIEDHFKTGQRTITLDELVLPYRLAVWQVQF